MRMQRVVWAIVLGAACTAAAVADRNALERGVRDALATGRAEAALEALPPAIEAAEREHDWPAASHAILLESVLGAQTRGGVTEERIRRLTLRAETAPPEVRPVLEAFLAEWYWRYFREHAGRFLGRSATSVSPGDDFTTWDLTRLYAEIDRHFRRALDARAALQAVPLATYRDLLEPGDAPNALRPTLYDLVAFEALRFLQSGEQAAARGATPFVLTAASPVLDPADAFVRWQPSSPDSASPRLEAVHLYQDLLRFHAHDADPSAYVDDDLWRLDFARNFAVLDPHHRRLRAAYHALAARWPRLELSARATAEEALLARDDGDTDGALRLARGAAARFPASEGGRRCLAFVRGMKAPAFWVNTETLWNPPLPTLDVRHRNLDVIWFRLVPFNYLEVMQQAAPPRWLSGAELEKVLAAPPRRQWSVPLHGDRYDAERTERFPAPQGVPAGSYYLLASARPDFGANDNQVLLTVVWITDLALVVRGGGPAIDGFVVHAGSGEPVAGAEIRSWQTGGGTRVANPGEVMHTGADGRFQFAAEASVSELLASCPGQRVGLTALIGAGHDVPPPPSRQTLVFTDRAIYRPGQQLHYEGLCVSLAPATDDYHALAAESVTVIVRDAAGTVLERRAHVTNDFGSFSGVADLPAAGVTGRLWVGVEGGPAGSATVSVEEYRRPHFVAALDPQQHPARLGDRVTVTGTATSYTGAAVDGARVRWHVTREVRVPGWWARRFWWRDPPAGAGRPVADDSTVTDAEGRFTLAFAADPDSAVGVADEAAFAFRIVADVTDPSGETRRATSQVTVGYGALATSVSTDHWQDVDHPAVIRVHTASLDGAPQAATGVVRVYALRALARAARPPLGFDAGGDWLLRSPQGRHFGVLEPLVPTTWPEGGVVAERTFATGPSGSDSVGVQLPEGFYRVRVTTHDAFGVASTADTPLQVFDPESRRCTIPVPDLFVARAATVHVGEEYLAVWGTGYSSGRAYVEVEHRGRLLQAYWTTPGRTQQAVRQPVTEAMRGGFAVRVTMVRETRAYVHQTMVDVPWDDRTLDVHWSHFTSRLHPGERETWSAVVSGADSAGAAAEMVATLYDASLDALAPLHWPDPVAGFRHEQVWRDVSFNAFPTSLGHAKGDWARFDAAVPSGAHYPAFASALLDGRSPLAVALSPATPPGGTVPFHGTLAPGTGALHGRVTQGGAPVAYANVVVVGARRGTVTDEDGRWVLSGIPVGTPSVKVMAIGFDPVTTAVTVRDGMDVTLDFALGAHKVVKQLEEIEIGAERRVATKGSASGMAITPEQLREIPVDNLGAAGELHFRGGRGGEVKFEFDGLESSDPAFGGTPRAFGEAWPLQTLDLDRVESRHALQELAFFDPHLRTAPDGGVRVTFTVPEALTRWRFLGFAHDRRLACGTLAAEAVTSRELMVQPDAPRFVRAGDEIEFTVKLANRTDAIQSGRVRLRFRDAVDGAPADGRVANRAPERDFELPPRGSRTFAWRLHVADDAGPLVYTAVAATSRFADGEDGALPVLARGVPSHESLPFTVGAGDSLTAVLEHLARPAGGAVAVNEALSVQVVSDPAWFAILALPGVASGPEGGPLETFDRLAASLLARRLLDTRPALAGVAAKAGADSALARDPDLSRIVEAETPWAREAAGRPGARADLAGLLDRAKLDAQCTRLASQLGALRRQDGAWGWWARGGADERVTFAILTGFGRLRRLGVAVDLTALTPALLWMDAWCAQHAVPAFAGAPVAVPPLVAQELYARSFFLDACSFSSPARTAAGAWLDAARRAGPHARDRLALARLALVFARSGDARTARTWAEALRDRAHARTDAGMTWPDEGAAWAWEHEPVEAAALMTEALDEALGDAHAVDGCRVAVLQLQSGRGWGAPAPTLAAVYALLLHGGDRPAPVGAVEVALGSRVFTPDPLEAASGFFERAIPGREVVPAMGRLVVRDRGAQRVWGALRWHYAADPADVRPAGTDALSLRKELYVRTVQPEGTVLRPADGTVQVGDEVVVRLELRADRDLEYVHLKDERPSGMEPGHEQSGTTRQDGLVYDEQTRDVATEFWFARLPRGTYVLEYPLRVRHRGLYASGVASVECVYAPAFASHSGSGLVDAR